MDFGLGNLSELVGCSGVAVGVVNPQLLDLETSLAAFSSQIIAINYACACP